MMLKRTMVMVAAFAAAIATSLTTASVASAATDIPGTFNTVRPIRLLDTRSNIGATPTLAPRQMLTFKATSTITTPVNAVALTITAVSPTAPGWLNVFPAGGANPLSSTVNFAPGRTTPNSTIVQVGAGGMVSVYNGSSGTVDVLADLTGFWAGGTVDPTISGAMNPLPPSRIYDSRTGGLTAAPARSTRVIAVEGHGGVPATGVSAVAINLTVTEPTAPGWLSAGSQSPPADALTSSVNFLPHQNRAALAMVPVAADGTISVLNGSSGTAHIVVDVIGYFQTGTDNTPIVDGAFVPSTPFRVFDSRIVGGTQPALTTRRVQVLPNDGVTPLIFKAVTVTVTAVAPQNPGFFTVWDGNGGLPPTSNGNFVPNEDSASTMIVPVNIDGTISVYNGSYGTLHLVVDVDGFLLNDLSAIPTAKAGVAKNKAAVTAKSKTAAAAALTKDGIARTRALAASHH